MHQRFSRSARTWRLPFLALAIAGCVSLGSTVAFADGGGGGGGGNPAVDFVPLAQFPVPQPTNSEIINRTAAIQLGKALFWDQQAGGDGRQACATCHFTAGSDNRTLNTINPGPNGRFEIVGGAGQQFAGGSFLADDIFGSQGIVSSTFVGVDPNAAHAADNCTPNPDPHFYPNRQVTGRRVPSIIAAIYNRDNFWDGRANHVFNGVDPFGATANAGGTNGPLMENSSAASQADGPPNNPVEMSCAGRTFNGPNSLGAKMLARQPLQFQQVSPTDSVLGGLSAAPANGLTTTYRQMIAAAFGNALAVNAEANFSRIWGEAIQAYESTLIPDQTPFDKFLAGNQSAMTASQQKGFGVFTGKGECSKCHVGPLMTDATVAFYNAEGPVNRDNGDQGYHNTGVRPTADNPGRAGLGPNGVSFAELNSSANHGAHKTPNLRNLKLRAPFFHNGDKATLTDVVLFYNRGGDFNNPEKSGDVKPLSFGTDDISTLVDFLTNATTDCRVEKQRAPFDHPSLNLPASRNGVDVITVVPATGAAGTGTCP